VARVARPVKKDPTAFHGSGDPCHALTIADTGKGKVRLLALAVIEAGAVAAEIQAAGTILQRKAKNRRREADGPPRRRASDRRTARKEAAPEGAASIFPK